MSRIQPYLISDDFELPPPSVNPPTPREEGDALDAYSRVVVSVAEHLQPAVVNLRVGQNRNGGSGSGNGGNGAGNGGGNGSGQGSGNGGNGQGNGGGNGSNGNGHRG